MVRDQNAMHEHASAGWRELADRPVLASLLMLAILGATAPVSAQVPVTRVNVSSAGDEAHDASAAPAVSADGRFIAFASTANNLVPADTNGVGDVFVRDRQTGETVRVSVAAGEVQANNTSGNPTISGDGRFIAFESWATNLVPSDTNSVTDVFVHDRVTGETTRVSVASNGAEGNHSSGAPSISADGQVVAFVSWSTTLVPGDTTAFRDVFVHDRATGETTLASVGTAGAEADDWSDAPSISADGQHVAFVSAASNLVPGDSNAATDVFVRNRAAGTTVRVSVSSGGAQAESGAAHERPAISADGRWVAFQSAARTLVGEDSNEASDIFLHDCLTVSTTRVSVGSGGLEGNGSSWEPALSADGRLVVFQSAATNLMTDTNGLNDIFLHDRLAATTERSARG